MIYCVCPKRNAYIGEMKQKIVIIGHGYTSRLGIIRSLAELDCEITVIAMVFHGWLGRFVRLNWGKPIDCHSKYINRMYYCYAKGEESLIDLLLRKCSDPRHKVIVIPDSDFSAAAIDRNQERLKEHFLFPHVRHTHGAVEHWMHKTVQKQLAKDIGLNVTNDCIVRVQDGRYAMPKNVCYPCFTKPLATISGGKQFLKRCDNETELRRVLDKASLQFPNTEVLVEDFKVIGTEYAVVGFSDGENVIIPGVIEFIVNSKSHFGIAREGKIMPVTGFESLLEQFREFVRRVGFFGLFDIDFYESDGMIYFGEMNLRFGGSGYAYTAMGVNLPAMFVKSLLNESIADMKQYVMGTATYVNERMCLDDYLHGYINEGEYQNIINSSDVQFVCDKNDMKPYRQLKMEFFKIKLKRVRLQLKRKMKR